MTRRPGWAWTLGVALVALLAVAAYLTQRTEEPEPTAAGAAASARYVPNAECLGCHADQGKQWASSHHAKAMAPASAETVLGRFDGATFTHQGVTSRFSQRDGKFLVRTDGADGKLTDVEVGYTLGVAPLQQYLIAQPGGRWQPLQIAWDDERKRWFHLLPNEKTPPGDVLHWTGRYQTANTMCISCHTTGFEKRYDAATDTFSSRWHEPNVSCQSCHGPGSAHADWARQRAGKSAPRSPTDRAGLTVSLKGAAGPAVVEVCATCHSRRSELTASSRPGEPRLDHYLPALLTEGLYHADGQQLDEVFVDGSYRQSKMHQAGVGCTSCHDAHTGRLRLQDNAVCTQCHSPVGQAAWPKAAGNYDSPAHHHHPVGSAGAQCVNCHMPSKNYMQIQARRDHSIRVPRPDLTVSLGTPNACGDCHAREGAKWAASHAEKWFGADRRSKRHYGEVFAAARVSKPGSSDQLVALVADASQPGIVRATALHHLRVDGSFGLAERFAASRDPDPVVRAAAADSYETVPGAQRVYAVAPLLKDPVRAVRLAAARSLSSVPRGQLDASTRAAYDAAIAEYVEAQALSLDMPGSHLNLAVVHGNQGNAALAEQYYRSALGIDPDFTPARANLVQALSSQRRNAEAEKILREGLARRPGIGQLEYLLGLLLAEENRLAEAAQALERATRASPGQGRWHYNLGLTLQRLDRRADAEQALRRAHELQPQDAAALQALAILHAQAGDRAKATAWAEKWVAAAPADRDAREMLARLR